MRGQVEFPGSNWQTQTVGCISKLGYEPMDVWAVLARRTAPDHKADVPRRLFSRRDWQRPRPVWTCALPGRYPPCRGEADHVAAFLNWLRRHLSG